MDVLLIDDHPIIHETMRAIVRSVSADAAFHGQFDLAGGLFRESFPRARVAVISASDDPQRVSAALDAGAAGYLPKTLLPKAMACAIRAMLDGNVYRPAGV